jgi:hypothetical protein
MKPKKPGARRNRNKKKIRPNVKLKIPGARRKRKT